MPDNYTIVIKSEDILNKNKASEQLGTIEKKNATNTLDVDPVKKENPKIRSKVIGVTGTLVGVGTTAYNLFQNHSAINAGLKGDSIGASRTRNNQAITNDIVGTFAGIGMGFAVGGLVGGSVAIVAKAIQIANRSIQLSYETKKYMETIRTDKYISGIEQQRLIKNISGGSR